MKKFRDSLIFLIIIFSAIFLLNTVFMYLFFGVNVLKPMHGDNTGAGTSMGEAGGLSQTSTAAGKDTGAADEYDDSAGASGLPDPLAEYMTPDEVQSLGELNLRDKLSAVSILSKVGASDSDRIYDLASDGVTNAEMEEIKSILESKLSKDDMDALFGILDKSRKLYAEKKP